MAINQYFKDTAAEMKHVNWPTKSQALVYTALVIIISLFIAVYIGALDSFFVRLLNIFIGNR